MNHTFQYRRTAEALYDALTADAFYIAMEASVPGEPDQRREAMLRYYDYSMQEGLRYGRLQVHADPSCGASIWSIPLAADRAVQMAEEKKRFLREQMGPASLETYLQITSEMGQLTPTVVPPGSWYLSIIGIDPSFQRQGQGRTLITPILEQTDALGLPTYLETFSPENMSFYRRLGFRETAAFDAPGAGGRYWVMARPPAVR